MIDLPCTNSVTCSSPPRSIENESSLDFGCSRNVANIDAESCNGAAGEINALGEGGIRSLRAGNSAKTAASMPLPQSPRYTNTDALRPDVGCWQTSCSTPGSFGSRRLDVSPALLLNASASRCVWSVSAWHTPRKSSTFQYYGRALLPVAQHLDHFPRSSKSLNPPACHRSRRIHSMLIQSARSRAPADNWTPRCVRSKHEFASIRMQAREEDSSKNQQHLRAGPCPHSAPEETTASRMNKLCSSKELHDQRSGTLDHQFVPCSSSTHHVDAGLISEPARVRASILQNDAERGRSVLDRACHYACSATSARSNPERRSGIARAPSLRRNRNQPKLTSSPWTIGSKQPQGRLGSQQWTEHVLAPHEMAQIGRAFREVFPEPPSALNSVPSNGFCLERITPEVTSWWQRNCRDRSEAWFEHWHAFVQFVRQRLARSDLPHHRVTYRRARRWLTQFVRHTCSPEPINPSRGVRKITTNATSERSMRQLANANRTRDGRRARIEASPAQSTCALRRRHPESFECDLISLPPGWGLHDLPRGLRQRPPRHDPWSPTSRTPVWIHGLPSQGRQRWPGYLLEAIDFGVIGPRSSTPYVVVQAANPDRPSGRAATILFAVPQSQVEHFRLNELDTVLAWERAHRRPDSRQRIRFERAVAEVCMVASAQHPAEGMPFDEP